MDKITHQVRAEHWTRILNECMNSGMSKTAWCRVSCDGRDRVTKSLGNIESINYSVSREVKKYAWFNAHIWGL